MWAQRQVVPRDRLSLIRDARDYALLHGLVIRSDRQANDNCVEQIPFALFPSSFPEELYQECLAIQPTIGFMMCKIANDHMLLESTLRPIAEVDDFTRNLLDINATIVKEGRAQPLLSCISRSDYMLDCHEEIPVRACQVEVNAIASSMSAHSHSLRSLHNYIMAKYHIKLPDGTRLPENGSLELVVNSIINNFDAYGQSSAYVLLVIGDRSLNFSDKHLIELSVHKKRPDVRFVRRSFRDLSQDAELGPNKELLLDNRSKEVALVYYRIGYDPTNYNFYGSWKLRLLLERSRAIKCPSINFHLSGAKKFQQVFNSDQDIERYLGKCAEARLLAKTFCKIWPMDQDNFDSSEQYRLIQNKPSGLVLKPQREGGGHNLFGEQIRSKVDSLSQSERSQYILMEYINSPKENNWILMSDDVDDVNRLTSPDQLVSELGIFGSILTDESRILSNETAGYLVRSKRFGVNEGGVAMGYAGIGNLLLVNKEIDKTTFNLR